jgi:penicillin amidase
MYADARGNIAYWHAGRIPIRAAGDSPWFPHIGAGIAEWQGFIPFKEMPHVKNPAQGWLANWNNKPRVNWFNSRRGFSQWGPVARVRTLQLLLDSLPPGSATPATVEQINQFAALTTDQPSGNASTVVVTSLFGDLLGAVDATADARLPEVLSILAGWNLLQLDLDVDGRYDSPAVAIFNTWWQTFINRVFADELGSTLERNVVANMAGRLLKPGSGLALSYDYLGGETVGQAVTGALIGALDALTSSYGSASPADWLQPAAVIDWSPIGAVDVPDIPWMNRGTYNQITHLGKGSKMAAVNVIAPGQSGNPLNPHFADQLLNYATFRYKPMRLTRADLTGNRESTLVLTVRRSDAAAAAKSSFEAATAGDEDQPERPRAPSRDRK